MRWAGQPAVAVALVLTVAAVARQVLLLSAPNFCCASLSTSTASLRCWMFAEPVLRRHEVVAAVQVAVVFDGQRPATGLRCTHSVAG